MLIEGLCPILELSIIVSLTYDGRKSWSSRFCNWAPVKLLGDISMSFYMVHMMAFMMFMGTVQEVNLEWGSDTGSGSYAGNETLFPPPLEPSDVCSQLDFNICVAEQNATLPIPDPARWRSPEAYCAACSAFRRGRSVCR